ncbi:hypothetical protein ZWY2020_039689 [Hordeum vulgare]|nr:hypothetical protein ZWY2020_039689 [Hordeum vulgare]
MGRCGWGFGRRGLAAAGGGRRPGAGSDVSGRRQPKVSRRGDLRAPTLQQLGRSSGMWEIGVASPLWARGGPGSGRRAWRREEEVGEEAKGLGTHGKRGEAGSGGLALPFIDTD